MDKDGNFKWYGRVSDEQWEKIKKKRVLQRIYESKLKYKYLIGRSHNRHIISLMGKYEKREDVDDFKEMVNSWNDECIMRETPNIKREWIIMQRPDELANFHYVTYTVNDIGKTIKLRLGSRKWEMLERIPLYVDKTFALFGDMRKIPLRYSFNEACETFIDVRLHERMRVLPIYRLSEKIVFCYDDEPIKALVCANLNEAEQFCYNLHLRYKDNPNVLIFNNITNRKRNELKDELVKATGLEELKKTKKRVD